MKNAKYCWAEIASNTAGTARRSENEEEEEEVWQEENQMALQWAEDERLEEILEQRREASA